MFFDDPAQIQKIAERTGCSIFVLPDDIEVEIKNALILKPEEKTTITVDQVRSITGLLIAKRTTPQFIIIRPANQLGEDASNALLKNLEEPKTNYHFILITANPSALLSTILSRSALYFLKSQPDFDAPIKADKKLTDLARRFVVASGKDLPELAETVAKKKDAPRPYALAILTIAIEMLYKSYFKTKNPVFLNKLPKFITAHDHIAKNGHIKLHLVADLL